MPGPIKHGLIAKSREAALTAVQTYNNPLVKFKSETFIVLMTIAWTYLLHAYYAREGIDYRYLERGSSSRRRYKRTPSGAYKYWELGTCADHTDCPLDGATRSNLLFLIGLRNEIEHHRPPHLDSHMSGRYLACALNYEHWLCTLFGDKFSLGDTVALALHFRDVKPEEPTGGEAKLPSRVSKFIADFEGGMTEDEFNDPRFAYRLFFTRKLVNHKGQADRAITFMSDADARAAGIDPAMVVVKDVERAKYRPKDVIAKVRAAGYPEFGMYAHTTLWQALDARDPDKSLGAWVVPGQWFWYEKWVDLCIEECRKAALPVVTPLRTK